MSGGAEARSGPARGLEAKAAPAASRGDAARDEAAEAETLPAAFLAVDFSDEGGGGSGGEGSGGADAALRFAGYAALFDREDRGGDIIRRGAFEQSIADWRGRPVPLLWQHRMDCPVGRIETMAEDARGLRVIGRLDAGPGSGIGGTGGGIGGGGRGGACAGDAAAALRAGRVTGLSFGYRVVRADGARPRVLKALDLVEVSLVSFPMQPGARVHALE